MNESVFIPIAVGEIQATEEKSSKTYRLDLDSGRIRGYVDEQEAVRQAIRKAIITPRFKCLIYDHQYGCEIEDAVIRNDTTKEYIEAIVPGFIRDALKPDTRILQVYDFSFQFEEDKAYIAFFADTIFGKVSIEEVIG